MLFSDQLADFIEMVRKEDMQDNLYISKVIHKTFIDINENGSEMAATTAVEMHDECLCICEKSESIEFKIDRPFLFTIQENRREIRLFQGKYLSSK